MSGNVARKNDDKRDRYRQMNHTVKVNDRNEAKNEDTRRIDQR